MAEKEKTKTDVDVIKRRLKEDRIPEALWPDEWGEKKKRPREVAFMDVNLCFPCGKCPEFCPVGCIEYLRPGTLAGRGDTQPVQVRFQECIGCYIVSRSALCLRTMTWCGCMMRVWLRKSWA